MFPCFTDTACKAAEMTFKQLYDHLTIYVKSPEHRWRLCMRVKRGLLDPNDLGGYGKDQCYFEGNADKCFVEILILNEIATEKKTTLL